MSLPTRTRRGKVDTHTARQLAVELLTVHRDAIAREKRTRAYLIRVSRHHGLTNQDIADILGLSEAGVRRIVERAGPDRVA